MTYPIAGKTTIPPTELTLELPSAPEAARTARRAIGALRAGLDPEEMGIMRLLVTELVTNSVRHAGLESGAAVGVDIRLESACVRVEVSDAGPGFTPQPRPVDPDLIGGWGFELMDELTSHWGVRRDERSHVWFELDRGPRATA